MSEYEDRDIVAQGMFYIKHVSAMTAEKLHAKSDIAAELAYRDMRITELEAELTAIKAQAEDATEYVLAQINAELRAENNRLRKKEGELRIKSEFLSARQCPDHNGKWPRGECLQCEIDHLQSENTALRETVRELLDLIEATTTRQRQIVSDAIDLLDKHQETEKPES